MMRGMCLSVFGMVMVLGSSPAAEGATIGPDAFGYTATNEIPFSFTTIAGTGTNIIDNSDDGIASRSIGFTFNFYGTPYTTAFVSGNGLLTFDSANGSFANSDLTATPLQASIAAFWDDLFTDDDATDAVYHQVIGDAGSRQSIFQWNNVGHFAFVGGRVTFQLILFEGTDEIMLRFLDADFSRPGFDFGASATVGIKNAGLQGGERLLWSFNQGVITDNSSILFSPATTAAAVPEPGTLLLLGSGIAAAAAARRRRAVKRPTTD